MDAKTYRDAVESGVFFYAMPDAALLKEPIDHLMWPILERINRCGWLWTTVSCQGHPDEEDDIPWSVDTVLGLACRHKHLGTALALLAAATWATTDGMAQSWPFECHMSTLRPPSPEGWAGFTLRFTNRTVYDRSRSIGVLQRFADSLPIGTP